MIRYPTLALAAVLAARVASGAEAVHELPVAGAERLAMIGSADLEATVPVIEAFLRRHPENFHARIATYDPESSGPPQRDPRRQRRFIADWRNAGRRD